MTTQTTLDLANFRPFRLKCKACFLTWPQNDMTKEDCLSRVIKVLEPEGLEWAVVASELHKDGTPHLHAICKFKADGVDIKNANPVLDSITGKHGNYQSARSPTKVLRYVIKDDNYLTFGDVPPFKKDEPKIAQFAACLLTGGSFADCVKIDAGQALLQKRKLEDFEGYCKRIRSVDSLLVWKPPTYTGTVPELLQLTDWLTRNILVKRKFRQEQLYIWGPPAIGKTTFIMQLSRFLRIYNIPTDEDYYDDWEDGSYDLAVMDEFKGHKTVQWLNRWLDGSMMPIKKKGAQYLKRTNVPTIILSNYSPEECYHNALQKDARFSVALSALLSRMTCIALQSHFNLFPEISVDPQAASTEPTVARAASCNSDSVPLSTVANEPTV